LAEIFFAGHKKGVPYGHPKLYASLNLRKHLHRQAKLISNQLQLISAKNRSQVKYRRQFWLCL